MRRIAILLTGTCLFLLPAAAATSDETLVPTDYEAGHFIAVPKTSGGVPLRLMVDTGGGGGNGMFLLTADAVRRAGLVPRSCADGAPAVSVVPASMFDVTSGLPVSMHAGECHAPAMVLSDKLGLAGDGLLGAGYLSTFEAWHFDYPAHRLSVEPPQWMPPEAPFIPLGFPRDAAGKRNAPYPSVSMTVDGQQIAMLLDTGATAMPTPAGEAVAHTPQVHGEGTTSYITTSIMNEWHRRHPDWRIVPDGDGLFHTRLIEVPKVTFGPYTVGPVWFTERPDRNFGTSGMGEWMDREIHGAIGANILSHFDMVVDYGRSRLVLLHGPV